MYSYDVAKSLLGSMTVGRDRDFVGLNALGGFIRMPSLFGGRCRFDGWGKR